MADYWTTSVSWMTSGVLKERCRIVITWTQHTPELACVKVLLAQVQTEQQSTA